MLGSYMRVFTVTLWRLQFLSFTVASHAWYYYLYYCSNHHPTHHTNYYKAFYYHHLLIICVTHTTTLFYIPNIFFHFPDEVVDQQKFKIIVLTK